MRIAISLVCFPMPHISGLLDLFIHFHLHLHFPPSCFLQRTQVIIVFLSVRYFFPSFLQSKSYVFSSRQKSPHNFLVPPNLSHLHFKHHLLIQPLRSSSQTFYLNPRLSAFALPLYTNKDGYDFVNNRTC